MALASSFSQRAARVAVALAALLGVVFALRPIDDFDIWYHVAAGRFMATTWRWPRTNMLAYTAPDHPWIDLHWLFQLLVYGAYEVAGPNAWIALTVLLTLATVAILYAGARRFAPDVLVAPLLGIAITVASLRLVPRPELVSFVLLATYLWILDGFPRNRNAIYWLVPLQALWTNSQGIFAVGLVVIGCYWAGATLAFLPLPRGWRSASGVSAAEWRRLTLVLGLATLACLLNPYGIRGALLPLDLLPRVTHSSLFSDRIGEFRPPFASGYAVPLVWTWAAMIGLAALSFVASIGRWHLGRLFVVAAFATLSTQALRNVALFAWAAVPAMAANLAPLLAATSSARALRLRAVASVATALALLVLIGAVVTNRFSYYLGVEHGFGVGVSSLHFPIAAEQFARDVGIGGRPFNCLATGGYLGWRRFPDERVFVDGRLETYPEDFFRFYFSALDDPRNWPAVVARYAPDYALLYHVWPNRLPLVRYLRAGHGWELVYYDEVASLYLPSDEAHRAVRERAEREFSARRATRPVSAAAADATRSLGGLVVPVAALRRETSYGEFLMSIGDANAAAEAFKRALAIDPDAAQTRVTLGVADWYAGRPQDAMADWRETLRRDPNFAPAQSALAEGEARLRPR